MSRVGRGLNSRTDGRCKDGNGKRRETIVLALESNKRAF